MKLSEILFESLEQGMTSERIAKLAPLKAEALKVDSYEKFKEDYMREYKRGLYWHITHDKNFHIDSTKGPQDKSSAGVGSVGVGDLMFTSDLEHWADYYSSERNYAALLDLSKVPRDRYKQVSRGFGNEFYLADAAESGVVVKKVVAIATAKKIDKQYNALLPHSYDELKEFYDEVK